MAFVDGVGMIPQYLQMLLVTMYTMNERFYVADLNSHISVMMQQERGCMSISVRKQVTLKMVH